jgi:hypothetical protein
LPAAADPLAVRLQYTPHAPEPPQHAFLWLHALEALYGGAAGGGKSDALLMAALQYVDVPGYSALLLRRTYPELTQADGLITRSLIWLAGTDAVYNTTGHQWTFPSGATLSFGYLATRWDHLRYQGGAYQFIGFDELTQFLEGQYRYLLSRLRRPSDDTDEPLARVPLRMRGATNPGGPGHEWVKRRFIEWEEHPDDPEDPDNSLDAFGRRIFIPARLEDNPHLDQQAYERSLAGLPRADREQLRHGLWDVDTGDRVYPRADVTAALDLGLELDRLAAAGELPAPAAPLALGIDWGEHTHGLLGYPLAGGGLYVAAGLERHGSEAGASSAAILDLAHHLPAWPGRREVPDLARLVAEARYDPGSAGAQSIRTFRAVARHRHPRLRTKAIPFNQYKREGLTTSRSCSSAAATSSTAAATPPRADTSPSARAPRNSAGSYALTLRTSTPASRSKRTTMAPTHWSRSSAPRPSSGATAA